MNDAHLSKDLQLASAKQTIPILVKALNEALQADPAFAGAAVADAILALEALLKTHSNIDEDGLQTACGSFGVALMNACTFNQAKICWANEDELVFDFCVRDFLQTAIEE